MGEVLAPSGLRRSDQDARRAPGRERIVVTRNGRPAAVIISPDDLESLEETLALLGDTEAVKALAEAEAAVASGDVVRSVDAVRALRPTPPR
jgi:antitoxin YefM